MAAAPSDLPSGVNQDFQNVVLEEASGNNPKVTVSGTISNGTIISGTAIVSGGNSSWTGRQNQDRNDLIQGDGGATSTIINGWDIKGYNQAYGVDDGNGGVLVNRRIHQWGYQRAYEVLTGTKAGNLTFGDFYINFANMNNPIVISANASAATITNNGTIVKTGSGNNLFSFFEGASVDAIVNNKTITSTTGNNIFNLTANATLGMLQSSGVMSTTRANLVNLSGSGSSIDKIELLSGSTTSAGTNIINVQNGTSVGTITATGATMSGNITLAGTGSITNGISLNNQSNMTGNLTLNGSSKITNGISLRNASNMTGNITLANTASIDNISISGNNASLSGNITIGTAGGNSASIGNITISDGGTYAGTIHTRNQTSIDSITIASGGVVGSSNTNSTILSSGNSTIHNIDIQDGGTMYGNIEAHWIWIEGGNANNEQDSSGVYRDGNIGNVSIAGRLQGDIVVYNKVVMDSLTMSGRGTITGSVRVGDDGDSSQTPTLSTITLNGNSGINAITLGKSDNSPRATINSITLDGSSSIGDITGYAGTIATLAVNGNSSIDSVDGTNIDIDTFSIANGAVVGHLITGDNNIQSLTNSGSITTLDVTGNVGNNNVITNNGSIGNLNVQSSVTLDGSNRITNSLVVNSGETLTSRTDLQFFASNGTLHNAGAIVGNINNLNGSTIADFNNSGNIDGVFSNNGHIIQFVNTGSINSFTNNSTVAFFQNDGVITNFNGSGIIYGVINSETINADFVNVATSLWNEKGAVIRGNVTLSGVEETCNNGICQQSELINDGEITGIVRNDTGKQIDVLENNGIIGGGVSNDGGIGDLRVNANLAYSGSGSITNSLEVASNTTLNASNSTINLDSNNGNFNNAGSISGNINNMQDSIINTFTAGNISGGIVNNGSINTLETTGNIEGGFANNGNTGNLNVTRNLAYSGSGSITNSLEVASNTTLNASNSTINLNASNGTINNAGNIQGSLNNLSGSTIDNLVNSGVITGSIDNAGTIGSIVNTGTITGNVSNDAGTITIYNEEGSIGAGAINTFARSAVNAGIITSNGGVTTIYNGNGNIGFITNNANSTTNIQSWNVGNASNPNNPIKVAGDNLGGINTANDSITIEGLRVGVLYNINDYVVGENGSFDANGVSYASQLNGGQGIMDSFVVPEIGSFTDEGNGQFSLGIDEQELSGKTLGASLIYSSRMRQIDTNSMLRELNIKNFKTDFEVLEKRKASQQALVEAFKEQKADYLNNLTQTKELKRVSSKESVESYSPNNTYYASAGVSDYYDKNAMVGNVVSTSQDSMYSDMDLLRELDDIFISHTGDKDNLYTFALPYTR
ncbi:beta strand repeat-containing protein, partial [Helicobacter pullorum]|uniref:beta strand repeat-containing protein n=1 Tax=Helicobacter pullorum TaxID=35818 RepID=UPI002432ECF9